MKIVSLFSGCGGLDLGLIQAGHEIIWANDIFADAVETYRNNIASHVDDKDIREIPSSDIPDCDVIVGGFPCQGFSMANMKRDVEDIRNKLYRQMVRVIKDKKPKFFIGENVKGMASLGKGEVLKKIIKDFEKAGYDVRWHVVNAADYGVPQSRMRLIIFGVRKDIAIDEVFFPPETTHTDPEKAKRLKKKPWLTIGRALSHFPEPEDGSDIPNHEHSKYKLRFNGHLGHRRIDPNKPAPTVTGRGDEKGGVVVLHHPDNHRRMSAREVAATQSFPDSFVFEGTKTSAYRQIANAVPPLLGRALGIMLVENEKNISDTESMKEAV
ncbi:MAG: DNA cytosine methyltransferase [Candidatus Scalindua sp.]|mgnify:CR=1 FL=1|jgi:DNA (cytosine-5)-methyltransferase 1|nr:DNA cytosine methyltransferase [Candidatus Scalindua sp.]MBT7211552.1 DNA cytosine methyltransferase [Candidatus Scalindua sp.]